MDKELMDKLLQWEDVLNKAVNLSFIHLSNSEFQSIYNLYKEATGKVLTKSQLNCNSCRLRSIQELGKLYFKAKEENKPKRGRPKKIDIDA